MNKTRCIIIGAAPVGKEAIEKADICSSDFIIAADGGLATLNSLGIKPDRIIGDFDSFKGEIPPDSEIHPVEKDETDTAIALREAYEAGYRTFLLLGVLGGERPDHGLAALFSSAGFAGKSCDIKLIADKYTVYILHNGKLKIQGRKDAVVSVFALDGPATGINYSGLKYPAANLTLFPSVPLAVSNSFIREEAEISIENGTLAVYVYD